MDAVVDSAASERPDEAAAQALEVTKESDRFNIGFTRTVNNPLLALALLQELYRSRFSFELGGSETIGARLHGSSATPKEPGPR